MHVRPVLAKRMFCAKAFRCVIALLVCVTLISQPAHGQLFRNFQLPTFKSQPGGLFNQLPQKLEQAGIQAVYNAVGKALGDDLPIHLDARTALPPVAPPVNFSPTVIACTAGNANMRLPPGDYTCQVRAYCTMDSIHRPGAGVPYELAPLQGKQGAAIATMFNRGAAADIAPQTLQVISWSIQASIPLSQMPRQNQAVVHQLIPEYERGLNGDFLQNVESTYARLAPIAHLPPFETMLDRMGGPGQTIKSILRSREIIRQNALHFDRLNEQLYDGPPGQEIAKPIYPIPSPWSEIYSGVVAQITVQQGNLGLNTLNFRVLKRETQLGSSDIKFSAENVSFEAREPLRLAQGPFLYPEIITIGRLFGFAAASAEFGAPIVNRALIAYSIRYGAQALMMVMSGSGGGGHDPRCPENWNKNSTQTRASDTLWQARDGSGARLDVENPSPNTRPGQIHLEVGGQKYLWNNSLGRFITLNGQPLSGRALSYLADERFLRALQRGVTQYLGLPWPC